MRRDDRTRSTIAAALAVGAALMTGCAAAPPEESPVEVLSAYWGADETINVPGGPSVPICTDPDAHDGMPITFSQRIDPASVQPGRFRVDGVAPSCTTLQPAAEPNERMTVLLIGDFGDSRATAGASGKDDLRVDIDGLRTIGGQVVRTSVTSTTLNPGEWLVWAERRTRASVPPTGGLTEVAAWDLADDQCANDPANTAVRLVFSGGITDADDASAALEAGDFGDFEVSWTAASSSGTTAPVGFGDQGDRDNILDLCLPVSLPPNAEIEVEVPAGTVLDPAGAPNVQTEIALR
jgi:hypothetical protein